MGFFIFVFIFMFLGGRGEGLVHVVVVKPLLESQALSPIINQDENVPIAPLLLTSTIPRALEKKKKKPLIAFHLMFFLLGVVERCTQMFIKIDLLESFEDIPVLELFAQLDLIVCVMIVHLFYSNIIKHDMN